MALPHGLDQVVNRAGRNALDVGLLDEGGQSLLGHPSRLKETREIFQEAREIAAAAKPRDTQFHRPGPRLPVALAVAIELGQSKAILLAIARAGLLPDLQLHQLLGSKADHLPQQIGVGALLNE